MGKISMNQFLKYKKIKDVKDMITEKQYVEINKLFNYYDTNTIKNRLQSIRGFIINQVETNWLGRLKIITSKLKNDVISEYACKVRYGDNWKKKQDILKDKVKMNKNNFIVKYGEEVGLQKWEERNKKVVSYGLNPAILRYGYKEGKKRWEKTLKQKIETMSETKKIRPYRNGRTLPEYQQKYGVEIGYKKWVERNKKQSHRFSLHFFLEKYGEDVGTQEWEKYCNSMSKTTEEAFIKRYGDILGKDRYCKFIERMSYIQTEDYYVEKHGEKFGPIKYQEIIMSKISSFKDKYSKVSQDLFWNIYEKLPNDYRKNCYFYELNNEYCFYVWEDKINLISVDFKLGNKIIEFDGDYWHSTDKQKKIDIIRDDILNKKGYIIKRIKENEYRLNKVKIVNDCLEFLKNE